METSTKSLKSAAMVTMVFGVLQVAQAAGPTVVDPAQPVAGMSQLDLSQQWWQWALSIPAATNPLTDGSGVFANTNNNGPVYFLAGNTGGTSVRTFNLPAGKPIFFPVINYFDAEVPNDPNCDLQCAFGYLAGGGMDSVVHLHATLDAQDLLLAYPDFRQTSTSFFDIDLPVDNPFGFGAPYVGPLKAVSDGHWVAIDGLDPGKHILVFGGTSPAVGMTLAVTDSVTAVPEPEMIAMLLAGLGVVGWSARRKGMQVTTGR